MIWLVTSACLIGLLFAYRHIMARQYPCLYETRQGLASRSDLLQALHTRQMTERELRASSGLTDKKRMQEWLKLVSRQDELFRRVCTTELQGVETGR